MDYKEGKKNYSKPVLSQYGDLKEITRGRKCCPQDSDHVAGQS